MLTGSVTAITIKSDSWNTEENDMKKRKARLARFIITEASLFETERKIGVANTRRMAEKLTAMYDFDCNIYERGVDKFQLIPMEED